MKVIIAKEHKLRVLFFFLSIFPQMELIAQISGNTERGLALFKKECAACHHVGLTKDLIGPALKDITEKRSRDWLQVWIKNNKELREIKKDKDAIAIYEQYNKLEMNLFPHLSQSDIDDILAFTKNPPVPKEEKTAIVQNSNLESEFISLMRPIVIVSFVVIALLLLAILLKIYSLIRILKVSSLQEYEENKIKWKFSFDLMEFLKKYQKLSYVFMGFFLFISLFIVWDYLMNIDVNKGYKPSQPIYFSHKIHSGINKIDCQYCHSSAKYSKVSGIPSLNVCMNCHMTIDKYEGEYVEKGKNKDFYTAEIQKIYKAMGWDPTKREYSGKTNSIKWVRIHNMPDFVYFDHSQHITVGEDTIKKAKGVDHVCKACHGQVDQMDKVEMANDFTMGWCINCHRSTKVDLDNNYYSVYFNELHEKLKKQYPTKKEIPITVDAIGGLECAKCHY